MRMQACVLMPARMMGRLDCRWRTNRNTKTATKTRIMATILRRPLSKQQTTPPTPGSNHSRAIARSFAVRKRVIASMVTIALNHPSDSGERKNPEIMRTYFPRA